MLHLSEKRGRAVALATSLTGTIASYVMVLCVLSPLVPKPSVLAIGLLAVARVTVGLTKQTISVASALISDFEHHDKRRLSGRLGKLSLVANVAFVVGPAAGGALGAAGERVPVVAALAILALSFCVARWGLGPELLLLPKLERAAAHHSDVKQTSGEKQASESNDVKPKQKGATIPQSRKQPENLQNPGAQGPATAAPQAGTGSLGWLHKTRGSWMLLLGLFLTSFYTVTVQQNIHSGTLSQRFSFSARDVGLVTSSFGLAGAFANGLMVPLATRVASPLSLFVSIALVSACMIVSSVAADPVVFLVCSIFGAVCISVVKVLLMATLGTRESRGVLMGVSGSLDSIARIAAPLVTGVALWVTEAGGKVGWICDGPIDLIAAVVAASLGPIVFLAESSKPPVAKPKAQ